MSDSSLGDSLFSYQSNRRYFGSTESCRFGFECRRCSLDGDKCSYSDNCRHGDRCRNCDCSSSYFSSDFDDTQNFSRRSSTRYSTKSNNNNNSNTQQHQSQNNSQQYHDNNKYYEQKTTRYAEDFIKHVNNVKYNNQMAGDDNLMQQQQQYQRKIHHVYETIGDKNSVGKRGVRQQQGGIGSTSTVEYSSSSDTAMLGSNGGRVQKHENNKTTRSSSRKTTEQDTTHPNYKSTESHMTNESNLENKKYATINNVSSTKKSSNDIVALDSNSTTMKRRRNKTTGTIPKLNTFDSATTTTMQRASMRHDNNRSEMNLSQYKANDLYSATGHQLKRYQSDDIDRSNNTSSGTIFQTIEQLEQTVDNSITTTTVQGTSDKGDENSIIYEKGGSGGGRTKDNVDKQSVGDDDDVFVNNLTYEMPKQRRVSKFVFIITQ